MHTLKEKSEGRRIRKKKKQTHTHRIKQPSSHTHAPPPTSTKFRQVRRWSDLGRRSRSVHKCVQVELSIPDFGSLFFPSVSSLFSSSLEETHTNLHLTAHIQSLNLNGSLARLNRLCALRREKKTFRAQWRDGTCVNRKGGGLQSPVICLAAAESRQPAKPAPSTTQLLPKVMPREQQKLTARLACAGLTLSLYFSQQKRRENVMLDASSSSHKKMYLRGKPI